ncbi:MAG: hypothetical protein F9K23_08470 [Bacteroidetes bacterium]|nr:MAG: hypothetical protein F9K23_08470 [Bacteroidota bacterium]
MKKKIGYSFDDERVCKFCYDLDNKKIEVHFGGHYDQVKDEYIDAPCIWIIEDWEYAKCMLGDEQKRHDLNKYISIFSLILYMKYNDNKELEMLVNTVDSKYITLFFKSPKLSLMEKRDLQH